MANLNPRVDHLSSLLPGSTGAMLLLPRTRYKGKTAVFWSHKQLLRPTLTIEAVQKVLSVMLNEVKHPFFRTNKWILQSLRSFRMTFSLFWDNLDNSVVYQICNRDVGIDCFQIRTLPPSRGPLTNASRPHIFLCDKWPKLTKRRTNETFRGAVPI